MLAIATLVPDTALLVPGAAGTADVLPDVRSAALDAARALVAAAPARVVVVAPGDADRMVPGPLTPSLAAAGIDDAGLGWGAPGTRPGTAATAGTTPGSNDRPADRPTDRPTDRSTVVPTVVHGVPASVALLLLDQVGWAGPVTLVEVAPPGHDAVTRAPGRAAELAALGYGVTGGPERVGVLVAGSLSARRGPDAALAEDPRAVAVDGGMLADLADAGPDARRRLAVMAPDLAAELAVTAWAPWQVAMGGIGRGTEVAGEVHHVAAPHGVTLAVVTWSPR
ncbi:hypothetical protein [uncultured Cellulomonas sp.]|uniref:hypothetical protein n=1 Tax=uncultured Cellulomonas sp. TaxID=189682 RepID=UPI002607CDD5|nr:hypothetical protein [uncultured Cellulomonas sp.]